MHIFRKALALTAAALLLTGCASQAAKSEKHTADLFAMDTYMNLTAYGPHAVSALESAQDRIRALEDALSVTRAESEIARANASGGAAVTVSDDTAAILRTAEAVSAESGGALDIAMYPVLQAWGFTTGVYQIPGADTLAALLRRTDPAAVTLDGNALTVPADMQIDLGALAKGYAGDAVMQVMRENDVESAIISLGGNVQALGSKPDGSAWSVGITNPLSPDENLGIVRVRNKAVITSGNYERYFVGEDGQRYWHILDPADGYPADNGLISVTVIGDSGVFCDARSTALYVEGTDAAVSHWRSADDFEIILVTEDGRTLISDGIAADYTPVSGGEPEVITREAP